MIYAINVSVEAASQSFERSGLGRGLVAICESTRHLLKRRCVDVFFFGQLFLLDIFLIIRFIFLIFWLML